MEERVYEPKVYKDEYLKNKSGIYQIRNLVNGKLYIGSTENLFLRKSRHFYTLKKSIHRNNKLQNSYNKYGEQNFIFEVIEFTENKNKLLEIEQYWINILNVIEKGYNIQPKAGKVCITDEIRKKMSGKIPWNKGKTGIYSEETLQKMKEIKKDKKLSKEHKSKIKYTTQNKEYNTSKKVLCIETNTVFKSIKEAGRITSVSSVNIPKCCNGIRKTAGGYHWKWV